MIATTLADLWTEAERTGALNPALVDCVAEQDEAYGEFLHWCWRADRWPGKNFHETTTSGTHKAKFIWKVVNGNEWDFYQNSICKPFHFRVPRGETWSHVGYTTTARAAFEFLYAAWQKLTDAQRQQLWEAC